MTGLEALQAMYANPGVRYSADGYTHEYFFDGNAFLENRPGSIGEFRSSFNSGMLLDNTWKCVELSDVLYGALIERLADHAARIRENGNAGGDGIPVFSERAETFALGIEHAVDIIRQEVARVA